MNSLEKSWRAVLEKDWIPIFLDRPNIRGLFPCSSSIPPWRYDGHQKFWEPFLVQNNSRRSSLSYVHSNYLEYPYLITNPSLSKVLILIVPPYLQNPIPLFSVELCQCSDSAMIRVPIYLGKAKNGPTPLVPFLECFDSPELLFSFNAGSLDVKQF